MRFLSRFPFFKKVDFGDSMGGGSVIKQYSSNLAIYRATDGKKLLKNVIKREKRVKRVEKRVNVVVVIGRCGFAFLYADIYAFEFRKKYRIIYGNSSVFC
jgi:hypothetical protein